GVVDARAEHEPAALRGWLHAPAGQDARDVDHVRLRVAAVHAERVELEQLAGVVLVDAAPVRSPRAPGRHALDVVEIEEHGRAPAGPRRARAGAPPPGRGARATPAGRPRRAGPSRRARARTRRGR